MFVLRSKVSIEAPYMSGIGLIGPGISARLAAVGIETPEEAWQVIEREGLIALCHPGRVPRVSLTGSSDILHAVQARLAASLPAAAPETWALHDILAGVPGIHAATQDHFVAQMLNLDRLDAISFTKGCYTGQEVIARLHYLGNLKRRMFLCQAAEAAAPGSPVFDLASDDQAAGEVVAAAHHPDGGAALLVVLQLSHAESPGLRLGHPSGPAVSVQGLAATPA